MTATGWLLGEIDPNRWKRHRWGGSGVGQFRPDGRDARARSLGFQPKFVLRKASEDVGGRASDSCDSLSDDRYLLVLTRVLRRMAKRQAFDADAKGIVAAGSGRSLLPASEPASSR